MTARLFFVVSIKPTNKKLFQKEGDSLTNSHYLQQDKHLGDNLYVDNKDAYLLYNADLADFIYPSRSVSFGAEYQQGLGGGELLLLSSDNPIPKLQLQFFVGGANEDEAQRNVSGLVEMCIRDRYTIAGL